MGSDSTFAILKPTVKKDQTASIFVSVAIRKNTLKLKQNNQTERQLVAL